jgi:hypothetical protein
VSDLHSGTSYPAWLRSSLGGIVKSRTLDVLTVGSAVLFVSSGLGLLFYFARAKVDPSMEEMWTWKRRFYLPWLVGSLVVGLPCWITFVKRIRKRRK